MRSDAAIAGASVRASASARRHDDGSHEQRADRADDAGEQDVAAQTARARRRLARCSAVAMSGVMPLAKMPEN